MENLNFDHLLTNIPLPGKISYEPKLIEKLKAI